MNNVKLNGLRTRKRPNFNEVDIKGQIFIRGNLGERALLGYNKKTAVG